MSGKDPRDSLGALVALRPGGADGAAALLRLLERDPDGTGITRAALLEGMRLVGLCELPMTRLGTVIHAEPALAARALQLANARKDVSPVPNLAQALIRLGERGVRALLVSAAAQRVLHAPALPDLTRRLRIRAVAVALGADAVVRYLDFPAPHALLAGALHDIGQLAGHALAARYAERLPAAWVGDATTLRTAVDAVHTEIGEELVASASFPASALAAVRWHHQPAKAHVSGPVPWAVAAAVKLVDRMNIHPEAEHAPVDDPIFTRLGLPADLQLEIRREIWLELERLVLVRDRRAGQTGVRTERRKLRLQKNPPNR